ncbi:hypothetical protein ACWGQ5_17310 [Streptomyces sp. NPDC055722]
MAGQRDFWITNTKDLARLQRRLERAGHGQLKKQLNARIRAAARPVHRDLQQRLRTLPIRSQPARSRGGPSPTSRPFRAGMARAIRLSVTTGSGAKIWVDRKRLPDSVTTGVIVQLNEGRLRHPTFGNKSRRGWVNQYAPQGWWWDTIKPHMPRLNAAVKRATTDLERHLK